MTIVYDNSKNRCSRDWIEGRRTLNMAKKNKTVFVCQECGYESPTWMGQCICGAWNSFVEEKAASSPKEDDRRRTAGSARPVQLSQVGTREYTRVDTHIGELNRRSRKGLSRPHIRRAGDRKIDHYNTDSLKHSCSRQESPVCIGRRIGRADKDES